MSMKSLNEKLAEVCGAEIGERTVWNFSGERNQIKTYTIKNKRYDEPNWKPTTDLNQLRECYLAAEKDWDTEKQMESFDCRFARALSDLLATIQSWESEFAFNVAQIIAWVKHPELVALAILKAKGVV